MRISLLGYIIGLLVSSMSATYITTYNLDKEHAQEITELMDANDNLMVDLALANKELNSYLVTEESLTNLGASSKQAKAIIQASTVHNVSPKF